MIEQKKFDESHGSPYDRGRMDCYYRRKRKPHYRKYEGEAPFSRSVKVTEDQMTPEQIEAYHAGYDDNKKEGDYKDWGYPD